MSSTSCNGQSEQSEQEWLLGKGYWQLRKSHHVATRMLQRCRSCRVEIQRGDNYYSVAVSNDGMFDWYYKHRGCY